jgi:hypothetical protein
VEGLISNQVPYAREIRPAKLTNNWLKGSRALLRFFFQVCEIAEFSNKLKVVLRANVELEMRPVWREVEIVENNIINIR